MTTHPNSNYAPVNGLDLYYEVHGTGRPLVLLHGGLMTFGLSFGGLLPQLSAGRQVIGVELQGHGHTADTAREFTVDLLADDVIGLLDHLDLERADVFGFSLGALVAMQAVLRHPDRVDRLVLGSLHHSPDGYHDEINDPAQYATSTRMPTAEDFAGMQAAYAQVAPDPEHFDAFAEKASAVVGAFSGWPSEQLRTVRSPALLIYGDHDFVRLEHAVELHGLLAGSQLAVLPGTTHTGLLRQVDLVGPMVQAFLG